MMALRQPATGESRLENALGHYLLHLRVRSIPRAAQAKSSLIAPDIGDTPIGGPLNGEFRIE
jgi:hypothetical protein